MGAYIGQTMSLSPAVSTALRRLRDITGDPLLVRSRNGMTPTERGQALLEPVKEALAHIEAIGVRQQRFDPAVSQRVFNIATPDYLNAILIGRLVARLRALAPHAQVALHSFGPDHDYARALGYPGRVAHGLLGLAARLGEGIEQLHRDRIIERLVFGVPLHRQGEGRRIAHAQRLDLASLGDERQHFLLALFNFRRDKVFGLGHKVVAIVR